RNGVPDPKKTGERSELYDVKPDNVWGEIAASEKLKGIKDNFNTLGLTGSYELGTWYPDPAGPGKTARKRIHFEHYGWVVESFKYRLRRLERAARGKGRSLKITDVVLEIERRESAILYYMVCVTMELDFDGEDAMAKKVVQRLYEAMTTGLKQLQ